MSVHLLLACSGCDAKTEAGPLMLNDRPRDLTPAGWIMFDPYTSVTYCEVCWGKLACPRCWHPVPDPPERHCPNCKEPVDA